MAQYLADNGLPVVEPSAELPVGLHRIKDGYCTFWQHYDLVDGDRDPAELAEGIAAMHDALRSYQGDLSGLGPLIDLQQGSVRLEWTETERIRLRENIVWFQDALAQVPQQPLHGDTHSDNALITTRGIRWTDFEDAWHGPVEWDFASALEGPTSVPPATWSPTFELCFQLRAMYRALWSQVLQPDPIPR